jgi:hypothetical protein
VPGLEMILRGFRATMSATMGARFRRAPYRLRVFHRSPSVVVEHFLPSICRWPAGFEKDHA